MMKLTFFRDTEPCGTAEVDRRFIGAYYLEVSVSFYEITSEMPRRLAFYIRRRENLESRRSIFVFLVEENLFG